MRHQGAEMAAGPDAASGTGYAAIVLAGGAARRMAGRPKPSLAVAGLSMLERVLAAVPDAVPRVVVAAVAPAVPLPPDVIRVGERPPGGGPVAAAAAGLARLGPTGPGHVALLAADLPFLDRPAVGALLAAASRPGVEAAMYVDDTGQRQPLCAVWRVAALRRRLTGLGVPLAGTPLRVVAAGAAVVEVSAGPGGRPPWFDCDTEQDLARAERWLDGDAG